MQPSLYLASASPRRRELLTQIGVSFQVLATAVDEAVRPGEAAEVYVVRLAEAKARAGWQTLSTAGLPAAPVLGADTSVLLDGTVLGKPADRADALRLLAALSGRTHEVLTAVAVLAAGRLHARLSRSAVSLRDIGPAEAAAYWQTGEPQDKAGAYAIQGRGAVFVADLRGSFSGVMGLPLFETALLLEQVGIPCWQAGLPAAPAPAPGAPAAPAPVAPRAP